MNDQAVIPAIVTVLNILILIVNIWLVLYTWRKAYHLPRWSAEWAFYMTLAVPFSFGIIFNTFSAWTTYLLYFTSNPYCVPQEATWARYADRFGVFFFFLFMVIHAKKAVEKQISKHIHP